MYGSIIRVEKREETAVLRGVKLLFTEDHISVVVALKGPDMFKSPFLGVLLKFTKNT